MGVGSYHKLPTTTLLKDKYATPGYISTSVASIKNRSKITKQGESSFYAKTRDDLERLNQSSKVK